MAWAWLKRHPALIVALTAFVALQKLKWDVIPVVAIVAVAGLAVRLFGWA